MESERKKDNSGSGVLFNPYLRRRAETSKDSINQVSIVQDSSLSDDSDREKSKDRTVTNIKLKRDSKSREYGSGIVLADSKQQRSGFFTNIKSILQRPPSLSKSGNAGFQKSSNFV